MKINSSYYTSEKIFNFETSKLKLNYPVFVASLSNLKSEGDYVLFNFYGEEYIASMSKKKISIFENRCLHRSFPLKKKRKGNEKIICPYHGWFYNYEGKLIGVPQKNCFKILPKNKNLNQLVPEVCGNFLFASYKKGNLKKSLGRLFEVIEKISNNINKLEFSDSIEYNANWKLCVENSLDEYHIVKVHPTNAGYYGFMKNFKYFEEGKNLILFSSENSKDNLSYKEFCKNTLDNKIDYSGYKIFNLFPSTSLVIYFGFLYFTNFQIVSNKKTINNIEVFSNKSNKVSDLYVRKFVDNFLKKSVDEDKVIIERYQEVLNKDAPHNLQEYFSVYEERIKKFRQSLI
jgi:phenylpropionate dioxygenase-like ring-hydroxylating dioxygenase large terminal subunit